MPVVFRLPKLLKQILMDVLQQLHIGVCLIEVHPTEVCPAEVRLTQACYTGVCSTEVCPAEVHPTDACPTDICSIEGYATEVYPTEVHPTEVHSLFTLLLLSKLSGIMGDNIHNQRMRSVNEDSLVLINYHIRTTSTDSTRQRLIDSKNPHSLPAALSATHSHRC